MTERMRDRLVAHGALMFLAGMAAGFPFAFEILGAIELWPVRIEADMPGDYRGWRMAHLEGALNGILLIAIAGVGGLLELGERTARLLFACLLVTGWGNVIASWLGPLTETRGLAATGLDWNTLVFVLFMAAVVAILTAMLLVHNAARRGGHR